jgi:SET domain-containing protein
MKKLPHEGLYTRLKPSSIHGVGVFAIAQIPKGTYVFPDDDEPIVWVDKKDVEHLPQAIKEFYEDFAIIKGDKYGSPRHFDALTTSWYLNHSKSPNVAADRHYRFYALRDINTGEELTADYASYSDQPKSANNRRNHATPPRKRVATNGSNRLAVGRRALSR